MEDPVNDNMPKDGFVFIIIGKAYQEGDEEGVDIHVMLRAPDDDSAVRDALNALTEEGYAEAELDQIGTLMGAPDEEPHASAYQGALEGEVAIIRFGWRGVDWFRFVGTGWRSRTACFMDEVEMQDPFSERTLVPAERAAAAIELAGRGIRAIPMVEALFNGEARKEWGAHSSLDMPEDSGLAAAEWLGSTAKPLEPYLREAFQRHNIYAAPAHGAPGQLDDASVEMVAAAVSEPTDLAAEAAFSLVRSNALEHRAVREAIRHYPRAGLNIQRARDYLKL